MVIINKSPETLVLKISLEVRNIKSKGCGEVTWLHAIAKRKEKEELKEFIAMQKEFLNKWHKSRKSIKSVIETVGGVLPELSYIVLAPKESAELVIYLKPEVTTKAIPKEVSADFKIEIRSEKGCLKENIGRIRWAKTNWFKRRRKRKS